MKSPKSLGWIVALAALLRLATLGAESLWYDESFTSWIVKLPFAQMVEAIRGDVHPPLWYLIEWVWVRIAGDSEFALRLPAALFGVLSVVLIYYVGKAAGFDDRVSLLGALLVAVMPGHIYYSQDARMYPLLTCFVLLMVYGALLKRYGIMILGAVGACWTQTLGAFYVLALGVCLIVVYFRQRKELYEALGALALAGLGISLLIPLVIFQARDIQDGFWLSSPNLVAAIAPIPLLSIGWRLWAWTTLGVYVVAFSTTFIGFWALRRWALTPKGLILIGVTVGAPGLLLVASWLWRPVYLARALLPSITLLMLVWAYALIHLSQEARSLARGLVGASLALGLVGYYTTGARDPISEWADHIKEAWQQGDVIYHTSITGALLMGHYLQGLPYAMRPYTSDLNQSLSEETKAAMGFEISTWETLIRSHKRVWLVYGTNYLSRADEFAEIKRIKDGYKPLMIFRKAQPDNPIEVGIYLYESPRVITLTSKRIPYDME